MPRAECRICGNGFDYGSIAEHEWYPFCSRRCRLIDLGKWFEEDYKFSQKIDEPDDSGQKEEDE